MWYMWLMWDLINFISFELFVKVVISCKRFNLWRESKAQVIKCVKCGKGGPDAYTNTPSFLDPFKVAQKESQWWKKVSGTGL